MDDNRKQALNDARFELSTKIQSISEICDYLLSDGELTDSLIEEVMT